LTPLAVSTATWVFILLPLLVIWAVNIVDIIRRDLPRGHKAGWILIVVLFPVVGTIGYLLLRRPTEKEIRLAQQAAEDRGEDWPAGVRRRLPGE
jgi:Phospholipase_D-nuclease N-terminal